MGTITEAIDDTAALARPASTCVPSPRRTTPSITDEVDAPYYGADQRDILRDEVADLHERREQHSAATNIRFSVQPLTPSMHLQRSSSLRLKSMARRCSADLDADTAGRQIE